MFLGEGEDVPTCTVFFWLLLVSFFWLVCTLVFFKNQCKAWLLRLWFHLKEGKKELESDCALHPLLHGCQRKEHQEKSPWYPNGSVGSITIPLTTEILSNGIHHLVIILPIGSSSSRLEISDLWMICCRELSKTPRKPLNHTARPSVWKWGCWAWQQSYSWQHWNSQICFTRSGSQIQILFGFFSGNL